MYYTLVVSLVSVPCCLPRAGDDPGNFLLSVGDYEFINEIKLPKKYVMYTVSQNTQFQYSYGKQTAKQAYLQWSP